MARFLVYFEQVNQSRVDIIDAKDKDEARKKAIIQWKKETCPNVLGIEKEPTKEDSE